MEEIDIRELLEDDFKNDPIYRLILLNGLRNDLFTEGILSLHPDLTYSTVETGRIIERSDSTIRNHFRSDLIEYIAPERFGKYYRLNYQSVFRLHMIFLLMEKASKSTVDLLAELGMQPAISMGNFRRQNSNKEGGANTGLIQHDSKNEERFLSLEKSIALQRLLLNIYEYEKEIADINRKIDLNEFSIRQIKSETHMKYLEEKQSQLLTNSLKKTIKKQSFLGFFKKNEEIDIEEISAQIDSTLKEKYLLESNEKIKEYEEQNSILEEKKRTLLETIGNRRDMLSQLQSESKKATFIDSSKINN
ncbi:MULTISPECIES: hypothetical protein [Bacillota]|uniref:hypothetical protein n=1 Tax=Bacillota TaxID=1239 RepID=UPI0039F0AC52